VGEEQLRERLELLGYEVESGGETVRDHAELL
jgi:hypothetical protein